MFVCVKGRVVRIERVLIQERGQRTDAVSHPSFYDPCSFPPSPSSYLHRRKKKGLKNKTTQHKTLNTTQTRT